jgi:5-methylcytosine-specific restriction protein A
MLFPELQPSSRRREYDSYSFELCSLTVKAWLFDGKTHREIDRYILGLNSDTSKGFQAMAILHFIGLKGNSRNIFSGLEVSDALSVLQGSPHDLSALESFVTFRVNDSKLNLQRLSENEQAEVEKSRRDDPIRRKERLKTASTRPKRTRVYSYIYERNPDVVAEALERANGACEKCGAAAPFNRKSNGTPYLEVHHIIPLSETGKDTIGNVKALCPNCHRELHFG